ncbi:hypothetical protein ACEL77_003352 [Salmonella enterica subsp. enterica serovar Saintpaul]|nr:hypothetical protein [Salmonella enterica]EHJ6659814.1 hypothetical protein [Salmonella enterica subsp. enterica serovar Saintpaul]EBO6747529.1 hypothetical protein [Salmonella enterica]EDS3411916.1 hypothetical protein [Salmonella enterica]EFR5852144.1 hypothetical protein [Salmonella enterica]
MTRTYFHEKYYLYQGFVTEEHFALLVEMSTIRSDKIRKALNEYFVDGVSRAKVCEKHNVTQGCLSVKIKNLQRLSKLVYESQSFYSD